MFCNRCFYYLLFIVSVLSLMHCRTVSPTQKTTHLYPVEPKSKQNTVPHEALHKQVPTSMHPTESETQTTFSETPRFRVTQRDAVSLRKLGSISRNITTLSLHPKCMGVLVGAPHWTLARFDGAGNLLWSTEKTLVCPYANRCHETPRAAFLPNENVVALLDGDSLRMFNTRGRMMALRGGFLQSVFDFGVSPDGKFIAALYPHGLAIWRATGGLVRKPEIPGATRFTFDDSQETRKVVVVVGSQVRRYSLDFKGEPETKSVFGDVLDVRKNHILTTAHSLSPDDTVTLPADLKPLRIVSTGMHVLLGMRNARLVIVHLTVTDDSTIDIQEWEITGFPDKTLPVVDVNEGCIAVAVGASVYFSLLPPFGR